MTIRSVEPSVDSSPFVCLRVPTLRCPLVDGLTPRQQEVVEALWAGASNRQIAERLGCSANTIANHMASIYERLDVKSRFELLAELALCEPSPTGALPNGSEETRDGTQP